MYLVITNAFKDIVEMTKTPSKFWQRLKRTSINELELEQASLRIFLTRQR